MSADWQATEDGIDWRDTGCVELRREDGTVIRGQLGADCYFNGEEEVPVPLLTLDDGTDADFFAFKDFRKAPNQA